MIKITYQPLSRCPPIGHIIIARFQLLSCSTKEMDCSFMSLGGLESLASGSGLKEDWLGMGLSMGMWSGGDAESTNWSYDGVVTRRALQCIKWSHCGSWGGVSNIIAVTRAREAMGGKDMIRVEQREEGKGLQVIWISDMEGMAHLLELEADKMWLVNNKIDLTTWNVLYT